MLGQLPLFMLPLISVLTAPVGAFVILKIVQMFTPVRHFSRAWVLVAYFLLVTQAIGLSVMLFRLSAGS